MMQDITPELLQTLRRAFRTKFGQNDKIREVRRLIDTGQANYHHANEYAIEVGEILSETFQENLSSDILPNERMYYNIAKKTVEPMIVNNHLLIADTTVLIQTALNHEAGLGLRGQEPPLNRKRLDGFIERLSQEESFDGVKWLLDEPIVNFSQSVVDDAIHVNADFHSKAGLKPKIVRTAEFDACAWCQRVVGVYDYETVPQDVFRRHRFCKCEVDYRPGDGRRQDVHTKDWID